MGKPGVASVPVEALTDPAFVIDATSGQTHIEALSFLAATAPALLNREDGVPVITFWSVPLLVSPLTRL